ncbi:hypothetical protein R1flu_011343 [Riccia fluitans]|uniref:Uncharacterized protein n=1 Tax=Riccia fluitans TaxID=41844 RepID=A0ABD1Z7W8_9MARC
MSSENGVWVARATQQERGLNEYESGGRKRLERRGTSVSRKGSLRRGGRKKSFIYSFIWIIGEKVELGLVNWLVFKCLTLRGLLKGNFSDSELESIRVDNGSERDRVKHPSCSLRRFYEITNNPPTYDVSGSLGGNHFFTYTQGVISSVIERNSSTYPCETG